MKSTLEKVVFVLVVALVVVGLYASRTELSFLDNKLHEWLTWIGLGLGAFICFYRSRVLSPFRDKVFVSALIVQGVLFLAAILEKNFFGVWLTIATAIYFVVMPALFSNIKKLEELFNRVALPIPRLVHLLSYLSLLVVVYYLTGENPAELAKFGGVWIFILMIYNPLNREVFSRKTFDR